MLGEKDDHHDGLYFIEMIKLSYLTRHYENN